MLELTTVKTHLGDLQADIESDRNKYIGASDIGSIIGLNRYKSAYTLWAEKCGIVTPEDLSEKEAVRIGQDLEQYVAERFAQETGKKVARSNARYSLKEYPFMVAHIDRTIPKEKAILECKTASALTRVDYANGEIPPHYYAQVMDEMLVTGMRKAYIAILVMGVGFYWYEIKWNEEEAEVLLNSAIDFWQKVQDGTPPQVDGTESTSTTISQLHNSYWPDSGDSIDLTEEEANLIAYNSLQAQIKALQEQKDKVGNLIKERMKGASRGSGKDYRVSWKTHDNKRFNSARFKKENPDLYEKYRDESSQDRFVVYEKKDEED